MVLNLFPNDLAFLFTSPGPIFVELGPLSIRWYGLLIATAVLVGVSLSQWLAEKRQVDPELIGDLAIWLVIGAIPGARLYYVLFEWSSYANNPLEIFQIWHGGIAIHGAILGGLTGVFLFCLQKRVSFWQMVDFIAPSLILGQAIGRWGNFFNSEAFGAPTDLPWKLYIPLASRPSGFTEIEYFHPTFLYESLWNLMVFALLLTLSRRNLSPQTRLKPGTIFCIYLIAYSCGRLWIEALRTDSLMLGPLRIAQVVSLVAISLGSLGLLWLYRLKQPLPDVVSENA